MKVLCVVGTRPEAIKMAPVYNALKARPLDFQPLLVATAQHRHMLDQIFKFTNVVHTCAREEDKAIQILCRKLKFIEMGIVTSPYGKIMLFQKEQKCQSLQQ